MAKVIEDKCSECTNLFNCCCKGCFEEDDYSIFKSLSDEEMEFLMEGKQQINYNSGETVIKQNTASTYVICVRKGLGKLYVEGAKGKNSIVKLLKDHDFVTGGGLFNGNIQHFTISALTPLTCCLIESSKIVKLFAENNNFATELVRYHTKQSNNLLSKLVNLTQKYMPGRVAETLLYLKNDIYKTNPFDLHLTRQELAEMSNMTKESLVRIFQQFKESEIIKTQGSTIEIIDEDSLISISRNG